MTDDRGRPAPAAAGGLARWLTRVAPARARGALVIALVSDARVRALNRQYLGHDYPTDVLSFPASQSSSPPPRHSSRTDERRPGSPEGQRRGVGVGEARRRTKGAVAPHLRSRRRQASSGTATDDACLGDIVIARGVARRQARAVGHDERTELRVLALHGLLHLLGYDHERDRGTMARVERRLRRKGGLEEGLLDRATFRPCDPATLRQPQGRPARGRETARR